MLSVHTEGTFRAEGFDCSQCPRTFERESALTRHLEMNILPDSGLINAPIVRVYGHDLPAFVAGSNYE